MRWLAPAILILLTCGSSAESQTMKQSHGHWIFQLTDRDLDVFESSEIRDRCTEIIANRASTDVEKVDALIIRAKTCLREGKMADGRKDAETALGMKHRRGDVLGLASACAIAMGDYKRAISTTNEAIELEPNKPAGYRLRAAAFLGMKDLRNAVDSIKTALAIDPNDADSLYIGCQICIVVNDPHKCLEIASRLISIRPNAPQKGAPHPYYFRGIARVWLEQPSHAVDDFQIALWDNPASCEILAWMARAYRSLDKSALASKLVDKCLRLDANCSAALALRAKLEVDSGEWASAKRSADKAMATAAKDYYIIGEAAWVYLNAGEESAALKLVDNALAIEPKHMESMAMKASICASSNDPNIRDPKKALDLAMAAQQCAQRCNIWLARIATAEALAADGEFEHAIGVLDTIIQTVAENPMISREVTGKKALFGSGKSYRYPSQK